MNLSLSRDWDDINDLLLQTLNEASRWLRNVESRSPAVATPTSYPMLSLPQAGMGASAMMQKLMGHYADGFSTSPGPRYWAFVTGGVTPAALMGDWIASTIDQNSADPDSSATHIEKEALSMLRELFGLGIHHQGSFVSGATMSNFVGLACGRQWVGQKHNINVAQQGLANVPIKVLSGVPHSSIYKALSMLGIGRDAVQKIDTLPNRESIDLQALETVLHDMDGEPCIVVANAGTVNSVDFDDICGIVELREKYSFWLHVDAAFGGFAACSPTYSHLVNGWDDADSICIDAHKWLNVPYDSAIQLTRHLDLQIQVFGNAAAPYLATDDDDIGFVHKTPENSRRFRALPAWCTLMAYGRDGYRDIVERNCQAAQDLGDWIRDQPDLELLAPVLLNGVVFTLSSRPEMSGIKQFLDHLRCDEKLYLTPTIHFGIPAIRIGVVNWRSCASDVVIAKCSIRNVLETY